MWIDVSGGRLYVEVTGHGRPLLLLHGWPLDHRMFAPQAGALCKHFKVITYDRRGFGKSDAPPDLRLELDDIGAILDAIDAPSTHLLGMSQGGRIALRYAASRPERVRSLLLQGAVVDGFDVAESEDDHVPLAEYCELARSGRLQEVVTRWLQHPMMQLSDEQEQQRGLLREILSDYRGSDLIDYDSDSYSYPIDVLESMADFQRPTLLLTGGQETTTRRMHADALAARIPDCDEIIFENSGHLSNLTEPELYNQAVVDFCRRADADKTSSAADTFD